VKKAAFDLPAGLEDKKDELRKLADSREAQAVKRMADPEGTLAEAYANGDMNAVRRALTGALKTEEGSRLLKQLQELMK